MIKEKEALDAYQVIMQASKVYKLLFQNDKCALALAAVALGSAAKNASLPAFEKFIQGRRGGNKLGHEGVLKTCIKEAIVDGAENFDEVLEELDDNPLITDIIGDSLTYQQEDGKLKTVTFEAVRKSYREIIKKS